MKHFQLKAFLLAAVALLLTACEGKDADMTKVQAAIEEVLGTINIQDATAIYYKGDDSRASSTGSYFKLDINGNEVQLAIADTKGNYRDISILGVVNASPRYIFFLPAFHEIFNVLCDGYINNDALSAEATNAVIEACKIVCIADRSTGKLYRIPFIGLKNGFKGVECKGKYYLIGYGNDSGDWYPFHSNTQIYEFNPNDLTVIDILPENQIFQEITTNTDGFIGYFGEYSEPAKAKCPGGGLKLLGEGAIFTLNNTFYTADVQDGQMYRWDANGSNNMTGTAVCAIPQSMNNEYHTRRYLYNNLDNVYLFHAYEDNGITYKFDGNQIVKNNVTIPEEFYNEEEKYESNAAWYHLNATKTKLTKISKTNYTTSTVNISDYQIVELVSNLEGADLSFTGIRYSDAKKVIGKIRADNTIVIESAQSSTQNIYNLIPLN